MASFKEDVQRLSRHTDPFIFITTTVIVALLIIAAFLFLDDLSHWLFAFKTWVVSTFSKLFVLSVTGFTVCCLYLAFSRYGDIKLGDADTQPIFSRTTWFAMLFSAGMGIGLVFYGVAEPILHFADPPFGAAPGTAEAAGEAMGVTLLHWGIHAWGIYALLGLALAYAHHRRQQPLAIRSTLEPLLGCHTHRWPGKIIDIVAVLATLFGLATSLGIGAAQINAGLNRLFGLAIDTPVQISIIVLVTFAATLSLVTGLQRGIRHLSELNMLLAVLLTVFLLLAGPTFSIVSALPGYLVHYAKTIFDMSFFTAVFRSAGAEWREAWTIFYWAWWISWSPFVGTFIARISAGRTVREFLLGVIFVPTVAGFVWFTVFGGAALHLELSSEVSLVKAVNANTATAIFALLDHFPFAPLLDGLTIVLITVFFVTSSDSGSFVVDMLTSGGRPNPPVWQRIFWASLEGIIAAVLLMIGGLKALQAGVISTGLPLCLILIAVVVALLRRLHVDARAALQEEAQQD